MKNVAVFGAGRIGRIHAGNLAALPGVSLKFVCDPVAESAAALAQQLGAQVSTPEEFARRAQACVRATPGVSSRLPTIRA